MRCCNLNGTLNTAEIATNDSGPFGTWKDWVMCPQGYFVTGINVQFQPDRLSDDMAAVGVQLRCRAWSFGKSAHASVISPYTNGNTQWLGWSECPDNQFTSTMQLRIEEDGGFWVDDTGLMLSEMNTLTVHFT